MENERFEKKREVLHLLLCAILNSDNVYYQSPAKFKMVYPCFKYSLSDVQDWNANNSPYVRRLRFQLMHIGYEPDMDLVERMTTIPYCQYDREYDADGLHHTVFTIYI